MKPAPTRASPPATPPRRTHAVRIIGGQWKRSKLPVADKPGLRPTPDRVRETLFNWLGQDLAGWRCADAFAGTGALGFEAASRGAAQVLLVELDRQLAAQLQRVQSQLKAQAVQVRVGDGVAALQGLAAGSLDLVLLDPPFETGPFEPALKAAARAVRAGGHVYLEAPEAWGEARVAAWVPADAGLQLVRQLKAGQVHAHLFLRV
jgi:16S rRNA (guanine966-N2)-methyltransferase